MPEEKTSHVNDEGRTIVDVKALLRSQKVKDTLAKLAEQARSATANGSQLTIVRRTQDRF